MSPIVERLPLPIKNCQIFVDGTVWEQIFASHIFPFLLTYELCIASSTCHFFLNTSQISHLWEDLVRNNFSFPYVESGMGTDNAIRSNRILYSNENIIAPIHLANNSLSYVPSNPIVSLPSCSASKENYARRLQDMNNKYQQARERAICLKIRRERGRKQRVAQTFLDVTLFRILIPLPLTSLFLTIVLFTLHTDGVNIPIWGCALPLLFYFAYLIVFSLVACIVYKQV